MRLRWLAGLSVLLLLVLGSAHHKPDHPTPPGQTTTTTTTTVPTTTTTAPTTTTTLPSLNLTADLVITEDTTLTGHIEGNGFQILIDGANVTMTNLTVNNVNRIMWHGACGVATLTYVTVTNSGVSQETGAYPLHWHLCGDATRGTVVQNTTVRNGSNNAFVPHGSNGITFLNDACDTILGHCFWWDEPGTNAALDPNPACVNDDRGCTIDNSDDILVDGLTATGTYWSRDIEPCCSKWHRISAIILQPGLGNEMRNTHVSDVTGGKNCGGFFWADDGNQNKENVGWVFENNTADTPGCHGLAVWQNDFFDHVIDGFVGDGISHGAYKNTYHYRNVDVPYVKIFALGWSMADSTVGELAAGHHNLPGDPVEFTNMSIGSFRINDNGGHPATYVFSSTNLTCGDIVYQNPHPESKVIIDGAEC